MLSCRGILKHPWLQVCWFNVDLSVRWLISVVDFTPGETSRLKDLIPLHRFGDPREIADAAVFLAQNEYANNCVLNLDGGLSAV
jgi:NAD(P)-dependent dehydrogenase (short-subunit alcohol dehydrogenase family)